MQALTAIFITMLAVAPAAAACFGSSSFYTCSDSSGNSYNVSRFGGTTMVTGQSSDGGSWSQNTYRSGNLSTTIGRDSDGNS